MKKITVTGFVNAAKRKSAKRKTAATAKTRSQATGKRPSARLIARRVKNVMKGAYPNPRVYKVYQVHAGERFCVATCDVKSSAMGVALALNSVAKSGVEFTVE